MQVHIRDVDAWQHEGGTDSARGQTAPNSQAAVVR